MSSLGLSKRWIAVGMLAAAAVSARPAAAQAADAPDGGASGRACYQPREQPTCRSFWITEFGAALFSAPPHGGRTPDGRRVMLTWELGYMRNRSSNDAVGASVFLSTNDQAMRSGVRARYRRWLGEDTGADISPTLIVFQATDDYRVSLTPGAALQGSLSFGGWIGLTGEVEATQGGVRLISGVRIGSYAGAVSGLALPVAVAAMGDDS